jgi:hypothetical protein
VRTRKNAAQVRDELNQLVDNNDLVLVFDVTGGDRASNLSTEPVKWLHNNMSSAA